MRSLILLLPLFAFSGCAWLPKWGWFRPEFQSSDAYPVRIDISESVATLHRLGPDPEQPYAQDLFVLTVISGLKIENRGGPIKVISSYSSPFDDLRIRIRDQNGRKLVTTSHTLAQKPGDTRTYEIPSGVSFVELTCATPVGYSPPKVSFPYIRAQDLTPQIQIEFFGGFPGSRMARAVQTNRVRVRITDRTAQNS